MPCGACAPVAEWRCRDASARGVVLDRLCTGANGGARLLKTEALRQLHRSRGGSVRGRGAGVMHFTRAILCVEQNVMDEDGIDMLFFGALLSSGVEESSHMGDDSSQECRQESEEEESG